MDPNERDTLVRSDTDEHLVGTVEMTSPPENYISTAVIEALVRAIHREIDHGARTIILCSNGRHFCAGADIRTGEDPNRPGARHIYDVVPDLFEIPVPIVAAVQGAAIGAGFGLAMVADRRVAASDGRFAANFARLGFHPGFGMSVTVPRALGETVASDLLLTGRRIDAHEALRLGVVERVTEPDELRSCAHAMAVEIATSAPLAVRSIRTTLRGNLARQVREVLVRERFEQERLMATEDFAEGVAAINERRTPRFKGIQA